MVFGKDLSIGPQFCKITKKLMNCIIYAKYYLYNQKCNKKELDFGGF